MIHQLGSAETAEEINDDNLNDDGTEKMPELADKSMFDQ
jgi:hypothetical protein